MGVTETCNQNCLFCNARRAEERPDWLRSAPLRVARAAAQAPRELVLTGGEPTLRRDLPQLVRLAKARGAERVVLETNATLLSPARVEALARAGIDRARVHLPGWGAAADHTTRDAGGFTATLTGIRALTAAGVSVELAIPVTESTRASLPTLAQRLLEAELELHALVVRVPSTSPRPEELCRVADAAEAITRLAEGARVAGLSVRLAQDDALPPCAFPKPQRVAHLFALTPGGGTRAGYVQVPACARCEVSDRCPGLAASLLEREPALTSTLRPIEEDRLRRRLSVISSIEDQVARELVSREVARIEDQVVPSYTVRVNYQCNQRCHFCFVSTHLPAASEAQIHAALVEAGNAGARLALSGGEPTLNPQLPDYARFARAAGVSAVEVQTNATRLTQPGLLEQLVEAGVDRLFVSLHGATAEISDQVTAAPGTFEQTVAGLDAAHLTPLSLTLNFVFCELNYHEFPDVVRLISERWPRATLSVSFVAPSTDQVPRDRALVPSYTRVMPTLEAGLELALERGLRVSGFESMCGVPLCLVPPVMESYLPSAALPPGEGEGEFIKAAACESCSARARCFGVRRGYAEMNGVAELHPLP
ncbi:MAG: radical SAM protein [Polyangiaceae bacterium]|nr:radical SAM protein [Polyangiaceae bacterium]